MICPPVFCIGMIFCYYDILLIAYSVIYYWIPMPNPTVAFQGEPGAFSEVAAVQYFHSSTPRLFPRRAFEDVFTTVERRRATFGIIPIENSLFGSIHQNYDLLQRRNLAIVGEIKLRIVHALLVNPGVRLKDLRFIYSHPQALGQCEQFLKTLNNIEIAAVYDTAGAAKMIHVDGRRDAAAIAGLRAAALYKLRALRKGIESDHTNYTRFLILSRNKTFARHNAKTSIVFTLKDVPGALFKALSVFALRDINLHKIESRPVIGKPWSYLFYADIEGSMLDERCKNSLHHLEEITSYLKVLGSYEEGRTVGADTAGK